MAPHASAAATDPHEWQVTALTGTADGAAEAPSWRAAGSGFQFMVLRTDIPLDFSEKWNLADLLKIVNDKLEAVRETFHFALPPLLL